MTDLFGSNPAAHEANYLMRRACGEDGRDGCGSEFGWIEERSGQDVVTCQCGRWQYNAPRSETGREQRSVSTRPNLKPGQRARILARDNHVCVLCGALPPTILHVGHMLSVKEGRELGATEDELFSDENLVTMCEECNAGYSAASFTLAITVRILRARLLGNVRRAWDGAA